MSEASRIPATPRGLSMTSYRRGINAEHEAAQVLKDQGFYVTRCLGHPSPPDLFAARNADFRMIMIRRSRLLVQDAHVASIMFADDLDRFRKFGFTGSFRFEFWIQAPPAGWKYYEVLPKGIRRLWPGWEKDAQGTGTGTVDEAGIMGEPMSEELSFPGNAPAGTGAGDTPGIPGEPLKEEASRPEGANVSSKVTGHA